MGTTVTRIIGIDPGLRRTGWGVVDSDGVRLSYVASGLITDECGTAEFALFNLLNASYRHVPLQLRQ